MDLTFQPYEWYVDTGEEHTHIYIFGRDHRNKTVATIVTDFTPHMYVELPRNLDKTKIRRIATHIGSETAKYLAKRPKLEYKKFLFYSSAIETDNGLEREEYPFVLLRFVSMKNLYITRRIIRQMRKIPGIGDVVLNVREDDIPPLTRFLAERQLKLCAPLRIANAIESFSMTTCHREFTVSHRNISLSDEEVHTTPVVLSWDIEAYAKNRNSMPNPKQPSDSMFQISMVFQSGSVVEKYLLSSKDCGPIDGCCVVNCGDEKTLIQTFIDLIVEKDVDIIIGYNTAGFDYRYLRKRAELFKVRDLRKGSRLANMTEVEKWKTKWFSSAYGKVDINVVDFIGRCFLDVMWFTKREYKLGSYRLDAVAEHFLKSQKDPLNHHDIFDRYEMGTLDSIAEVGKYCVKDSALVLDLYNKMECWHSVRELANVVGVQFSHLYCRGQQIRTKFLLYIHQYENFVIPKRYRENETGYSGAVVFEPVPGTHENVFCMDFQSLYPSLIKTFNISWDTFVEESRTDIPDDECFVFEWEDHKNCEHAEKKQTGKKAVVICEKRKYRFVKKWKGAAPIVIAFLLDARKQTRRQLAPIENLLEAQTDFEKGELEKYSSDERKTLSESMEQLLGEHKFPMSKSGIEKLGTMATVLNKRQLGYKITANSLYGTFGANGDLGLDACAMCVTASGRQVILKTADLCQEMYRATMVYGDTDSVMIQFPTKYLENEKIGDFGERIARELSDKFPGDLVLDFEKMFSRMLIVSKKRYAGIMCNKFGNPVKILLRGLLVVRRDNCEWARIVYKEILMKILESGSFEECVDSVVHWALALMYNQVPIEDLTITKCLSKTRQEYARPDSTPQLILAERLRRRGHFIQTGDRIPYIFLEPTLRGQNQGDLSEDPEYYKRHSRYLRLGRLYYLDHQFKTPITQLLSVAFKKNPSAATVVKKLIRQIELKRKIGLHIRELTTTVVCE